MPDTTEVAFAYDADGQRVTQTAGGQSVSYLWDAYSAYGDVVLETGAAGPVSYTLANGQLISQTRGGVPTYYLSDGQGSTRALADASGAITDTYDYTAFGELYAQTGNTDNSYLYTGQQFDEATGLYDLRARYYAPGLGRFLSQDTAGILFSNPIELNRYGYTANNPVNRSDPSGLMAEWSLANQNSSLAVSIALPSMSAFVKATFLTTAVVMVVLGWYVLYKTGLEPSIWPKKEMPFTGMEPMLGTGSGGDPDPENNSSSGWHLLKLIVGLFLTTIELAPEPVDPPPPTDDKKCDPAAFIEWWFDLPIVPESERTGEDWYEYEQRIARAYGVYGNYTRTVPGGPVDADGISASTCCLVDAKYIQNPDFYRFWNQRNRLPWGPDFDTELVDIFERYLRAIQTPNGVPGSQPERLIVKISDPIAQGYYEAHLTEAGFTIGSDAIVEPRP